MENNIIEISETIKMIYKRILLKDIDEAITDENVSLRIYISERNESVSLRPGMLVCPGGGYAFCSPREAEPIAFRFLSEGFNCFILDYSINQKYPAPHKDLAIAFAYIRNHEKEFDLIPNCLSIVGFSAGGHLVASYGYLYKELAELIKVDPQLLKPFSIVMAYPVTTTLLPTHGGSRDTISGGDKTLLKKLDVPMHVTSDYPPSFIWTTKDDGVVPYENSTLMKEALEKHDIPYEFNLYESGWHGSSLVNRSCYEKGQITEKMKDIRDWATLATDFIFNLLDKTINK